MIYVCGDFEWTSRTPGNLNRTVNALLGGNTSQQREILARLVPRLIKVFGHALQNGSKPVGPGHRCALGIRDRDEIHVAKFPMQGDNIRDVQPAVHGRYRGDILPTRYREMEIIDMKIDDIEVRRLPCYQFDHSHVVCNWIDNVF